MNARRLLLCALVALVPLRSMAQLDDLLTPLTPGGEKPQPKKKATKKKRTAKPQPSPRKASAEDAFDPLLAPLVPAKAGRDYTVRADLELASKGDRPEVTRLLPEDSAESSYGLTDEQAVSAPSPWYQRWYVWAGVGAVAAAAITTAVVTSNTGGAPLSPSEVCGGPCDDVINPPASALRF